MKAESFRFSALFARRKWFVSVILPAIIVPGLLACGSPSDTAGDADAAATVALPRPAVTSAEFRVRSELVFNTRADLSFDIPGEAGAVNVAVGDTVSAGDILATLDETSLTNLEQTVSQTKLNLDAARDALDGALGLQSDDPLVKAQAESALAGAESALAQAQVALEQAEEVLADFQFEHDLRLGRARQARAAAVTALDQAEEKLSDFADGHGERFANALEIRSNAKVSLENAQEALADYLPNYNESVTKLRNNISRTEQQLERAREVLADIDSDHDDLLLAARQQLGKAEDDLSKARAAYTAFTIRAIDGTFTSLDEGEVFDVVQHNALRAGVTAAERTVAKWEDEIEELRAGPKELDRAVAKDNISVLEEQLARLNREITDLQDGPDQDEIRLLEARIQSARERLDRSERELAEAEEGVDQLELARLQSIVDSRRLDVDSAVNRLTKLEEGPDQTELASLNTAVDTARQSVITAREARDDLAAGSDATSIAQARFRIETAAFNYSEAQKTLDDAVLRAPFDGLVRVVTIAPGDVIKVDARVIQLVDASSISVIGLVETNHIDRIKVGSRAEVTLSAVPGTTFAATAGEVSTEARTERGVISFPVVFSVTVPDGVLIPPNPGLVTTMILP